MKDLALATLTAALSALTAYCIVAFVLYEADAGKWSIDARMVYLFITFAICSGAADHFRRKNRG